MTMRKVLFGVFLGLTVLLANPVVEAQEKNVVFISVDDLKSTVGFLSEQPGNFLQTIYPDPVKREEIRAVLTPNIDALAAQGVTFVRCQCPSAACRSSRAAVMTGLRPHDSGISRNQDPYFRNHPTPFVRNAITLPQNLYRNGYYTAGVGKIFHSNIQADQGKSWRHWLTSQLGTAGSAVPSIFDPTPRFPGTNVRFGRATQPVPVHHDYINAQAIGNMVQFGSGTIGSTTYQRDQTKPFFLACGIYRPHLPLYCPNEFLELFDPDEMAISRSTLGVFRQDIVGLSPPAYARIRANSNGTLTSGCFYEILTHGRFTYSPNGDIEGWKAFIQHYLGCVAFADRCVGRLLNGIASSEHADDTLVVLWSDHGYALGEKMKVHKHAFWADENDALLIIKDPQTPETAGQLCYSPVGLIDLYRTINSYCDVAVPYNVAGVT